MVPPDSVLNLVMILTSFLDLWSKTTFTSSYFYHVSCDILYLIQIQFWQLLNIYYYFFFDFEKSCWFSFHFFGWIRIQFFTPILVLMHWLLGIRWSWWEDTRWILWYGCQSAGLWWEPVHCSSWDWWDEDVLPRGLYQGRG